MGVMQGNRMRKVREGLVVPAQAGTSPQSNRDSCLRRNDESGSDTLMRLPWGLCGHFIGETVKEPLNNFIPDWTRNPEGSYIDSGFRRNDGFAGRSMTYSEVPQVAGGQWRNAWCSDRL